MKNRLLSSIFSILLCISANAGTYSIGDWTFLGRWTDPIGSTPISFLPSSTNSTIKIEVLNGFTNDQLTAIQDAISMWAVAFNLLQPVYAGTRGTTSTYGDGVNAIEINTVLDGYYNSKKKTGLAAKVAHVYAGGYKVCTEGIWYAPAIIEADVWICKKMLDDDVIAVLTSAECMSSKGGPDKTDFKSVIIHELGHLLGLGHHATASLDYSMVIMKETIANCECFYSIHAKDLEALEYLYGASSYTYPYTNLLPCNKIIGSDGFNDLKVDAKRKCCKPCSKENVQAIDPRLTLSDEAEVGYITYRESLPYTGRLQFIQEGIINDDAYFTAIYDSIQTSQYDSLRNDCIALGIVFCPLIEETFNPTSETLPTLTSNHIAMLDSFIDKYYQTIPVNSDLRVQAIKLQQCLPYLVGMNIKQAMAYFNTYQL